MIKDLINIKKGEVISVIGSGGKSTFIYNLSKELREDKVMISTTTKMFYPQKDEDVDKVLDLNGNESIKREIYNGITFLLDNINGENKVSASIENIKKYIDSFDYTLLEGDGSKKKPLKGWKDDEPIIIEETTKTVGIIPINIIGERINSSNIHRIELFKKMCKKEEEDKITIEVIKDVICDKKGLFKNVKGEKILFLNKIDEEKNLKMARLLLEKLNKEELNFSKILGGSLKRKIYYEFN